MKQLGIASFTANGHRVADALAAALEIEYEIVRYEKGLKDWCGGLFAEHAEGIIFVGACGIAVRTIAPFLVSKTTDPAVLVIDEKGQFVISLLSGHIGGANRLALRAADVLGATPVITTATDVNGKFAVDVFASDNHLRIEDMRLAKEISAAILRGERVGIFCEGEMEGDIPPELTLVRSRLWSGRIPDSSGVAAHFDDVAEGSARTASERTDSALEKPSTFGDTAEAHPIDALVCIGVPSHRFVFSEKRSEHSASSILRERKIDLWVSTLQAPILHLLPKAYVLGIGCRKGKSEQAIADAVDQVLSGLGISLQDIVGVASIDLKKEEPGLVEFCKRKKLDFRTFPAETLAAVPGDFSGSSFVQSVTGVDNVCERAALCLARLLSEKADSAAHTRLDCESKDDDLSGRLILGKQAIDGVTVAVAEQKWSVRF